MEKPKPKREVAIRSTSARKDFIAFYASSDAAEEFKEFGRLEPQEDYYWLYVDGRFDFDEVLSYMENYK